MKIVVDGNIGSGKTTQLDILEKDGWNVKREPIDKWPLELYYSDPKRWGFLFQIIILQTLTCDDSKKIVYERSPISSRDVFWKIMEKTEVENEAYLKQFDIQAWLPDLYIYIDKSPENCFTHVNDRYQKGDNQITLEYLEKLDENYKCMFDNLKCEKYIIDGNDTIENINIKIKNILIK